MFILDRLIVGGLGFVLDKVAQAVDSESDTEPELRERLYAAQLRYELGEIDGEEFAALEKDLLAAMRELRERRRQEAGAGAGGRISGVEVEYGGEDE